MFWGSELKAGEALPVVVADGTSLHLTQIVLGPNALQNDRVFIEAIVEDQKIIVAALDQQTRPCVHVNLIFPWFQQVSLSVAEGKSSVFLSGFIDEDMELDSDEEDGEMAYSELYEDRESEEDDEAKTSPFKKVQAKEQEVPDDKEPKKATQKAGGKQPPQPKKEAQPAAQQKQEAAAEQPKGQQQSAKKRKRNKKKGGQGEQPSPAGQQQQAKQPPAAKGAKQPPPKKQKQ